MRIDFNLRVGMKPSEIFAELRGRVSGETSQEMREFYIQSIDTRKATDSGLIELGSASHRIVLSDGEYAVIERIDGAHFLCGINDEGKYFVHRLQGFPSYFATNSMEQVLAWVNRADEGFTMRVQGDILVQFVPASCIRQEKYGATLDTAYLPRLRNMGTYLSPANQRATLGNHTVTTDGKIYVAGATLLVVGEQVTLQHPQHGVKTVDIPKAHAALLAGQAGRGMAGFD